jgi:hypothetical protein
MTPLSENDRRDFLDICDERYQTRATVLNSQLPMTAWHLQLLSRSERKLIAITTLPHVEVDEVYPGHSNANQYLVLLGCGRGNLPQVHDLGTTSCRKLNRLHRDRFLWAITALAWDE